MQVGVHVKVKGLKSGGESSCESLRSQKCMQKLWANQEGGIGNRAKIKNTKCDTPPNSLIDLIVNPKVKTTKG